ncbi:MULTISPECIES: Na+/H+ antiporter NhaA [unclassified Rhizobacter]|uniref:Na+/H+ antiporter NhaA n=1 Tax=unclassified Rhizobacter TaxID=2640088 RepID=UPI0006F62772|nr:MULTISPECIES: Na+/H+ antiporter NhaA [unclassified Rhizobacter]KQU81544.1 sodium:proton antiporter [Rhizobacter sp. Root29]KQW12125.1 sodium:proton antiporter [Rhizobacter sp. Root1238]KRB02940.1 sodium:proton antiporter [Rhizobacter sp. Root16D2]
MLNSVRRFIASESAGGVVLALAAAIALVVSNSPWHDAYQRFVGLPGELRIGGDLLVLAKPLLLWVNDLWMAVFFFLVGLEIKRELLAGELASARQALLPAGAAVGGMAVPALIYALINLRDPVALHGWAIPAATDIAFALGILMLLGSRVPASLKVFLTAVAIIDDLGAIVVIAFFYTADVSLTMLGAALAGGVVLFLMNRSRVMSVAPYVVVGLVIWVCVLKSGVHATLAGVATALAIPLRGAGDDGHSPLEATEHALHPWVAFAVLPMFAFANAGVSLQGVSFATLAQTVPLGIAAGLVLGKAIGVFGASWLLIRLAGAELPAGASTRQFFGVCVLCGVGFTMSLFIGALAFEGRGGDYETQVKLGVLCGSLVAGVIGTLLLLGGSRQAQ